eukprot:CAMPEP_0178444176 /NCGR_PEP_ID=MMETSP0689_2-20121128/39339_1 /TAXON_ID=160604 /ORGANISM="Amphidinium massartii, Strain CS-259" /LENGTH=97 /DNA_ID=CAMNT_0020068333 /DNA_START=12 /DNA_END=303 /DNA_ORIENTATION=+
MTPEPTLAPRCCQETGQWHAFASGANIASKSCSSKLSSFMALLQEGQRGLNNKAPDDDTGPPIICVQLVRRAPRNLDSLQVRALLDAPLPAPALDAV